MLDSAAFLRTSIERYELCAVTGVHIRSQPRVPLFRHFHETAAGVYGLTPQGLRLNGIEGRRAGREGNSAFRVFIVQRVSGTLLFELMGRRRSSTSHSAKRPATIVASYMCNLDVLVTMLRYITLQHQKYILSDNNQEGRRRAPRRSKRCSHGGSKNTLAWKRTAQGRIWSSQIQNEVGAMPQNPEWQAEAQRKFRNHATFTQILLVEAVERTGGTVRFQQ